MHPKQLVTALFLVLLCFGCSPEPAKKSDSLATPAPENSVAPPPAAAPAPNPAPTDTTATPGDDGAAAAEGADNTDGSDGSGQTFHGYDCRDDCSGHQAGYDWAEQHGITDPDSCDGNSQSFIEGCKAFAGEDGPEGDSNDDDVGDKDNGD